MNPLEHHDNQTDQAVRTLVGLVVAAAGTATVLASGHRDPAAGAGERPRRPPDDHLHDRHLHDDEERASGSARRTTRSTWSETAIVLGLFVAPTHWVILCTAVGVAAAAGIARLSRLKTAFRSARTPSSRPLPGWPWPATAAGPDTLAHLLAAATVGYLVAVVADELITLQVIALVSRTPLPTLLRTDWDLRLLGTGFRYLATLGTLVVLFVDHRLLPALPALVLSLHLAYSHRVRGRAEQQAWQRLARTTDALNVVDLDRVLTTAVTRPAELFSADQVEIELPRERTVRGSGGRISYDGPSAGRLGAPAQIETRLRGARRRHRRRHPAAALPRPGRAHRTRAVHPAHLRRRTLYRGPQRPGVRRTARVADEHAHAAEPRPAHRAAQPPAHCWSGRTDAGARHAAASPPCC